jgi:hypothetical protein
MWSGTKEPMSDELLFDGIFRGISDRKHEFTLQAQSHRDEHYPYRLVRGAFVLQIPLREVLRKGQRDFIWLDQEKLTRLYIEEFNAFLKIYDPEKYFVVFLSICLSREKIRKGECDMVFRFGGIPCTFTPDHLVTTVLDAVPPTAIQRTCGSSSCSNTKSICRMKVCNGCKCIEYCSVLCQTQDWKALHQTLCRRIRDARLNAIKKMTSDHLDKTVTGNEDTTSLGHKDLALVQRQPVPTGNPTEPIQSVPDTTSNNRFPVHRSDDAESESTTQSPPIHLKAPPVHMSLETDAEFKRPTR